MTDLKALSEAELLPCPFCGGEAKIIDCLGDRIENGPPYYERLKRAVCDAAGCSCASMPACDESVAIGNWNARTPALHTTADLEAAKLAERERCAVIADIQRDVCGLDQNGAPFVGEEAHLFGSGVAHDIATAIRNRSQETGE